MGEFAARMKEWAPADSLRWDLLAIVTVAIAVQVVFPDRADWVAHVMAGGALVVIADATLGSRVGAWALNLGTFGVLVLAVVAELTVTGPFDPSDVAFTLAGALLVNGGSSIRSNDATSERHNAHLGLAWGMALLGVAVYYRYGIRRGP